MALAVVGAPVITGQERRLPTSLSDQEFWWLTEELSEPDGFFEDENYVSNELGYQRSMRHLRDTASPGGAFVGVGPEQNFSYIAALQPGIAFIVDIRRQNLVLHLMYKALFETASNRVEFVGRLFSRRPTSLPGQGREGAGTSTPPEGVTADEIFKAYAASSPDDRLFDETLASVLATLTERHGFPLSAADRAALRKVLSAFRDSGPDIMYVFQGSNEPHPTYTRMMTARDEQGEVWSYLATEAAYGRVRALQRRNLVIPVVGDFAGPKALRAVGAYARERGATVDTFYASNVESYLFRAKTAKAFYDTLSTLPFSTDARVVRSFFGAVGRECATDKPTIRTPVVGPVQPLLEQHRRGALTSQCSLVALSR
jgi:hypothetical protein